jgi:hypothetical protein
MVPDAMEPLGEALLAYLDGDTSAELILRRDHGREAVIPVSLFFRDEATFTDDPENLAYREANRRAGRYIGEIRTQFVGVAPARDPSGQRYSQAAAATSPSAWPTTRVTSSGAVDTATLFT